MSLFALLLLAWYLALGAVLALRIVAISQKPTPIWRRCLIALAWPVIIAMAGEGEKNGV